jgi:glycosyltransferase involved in cell wall biosynthesis
MQAKKITKQLNVCVVAFPVGEAFVIPLSNLVRILCAFKGNVYIITGNNGVVRANKKYINSQIHLTFSKQTNNIISRIVRYILLQIKISIYLITLARKIDYCFFFLEDGAILPMIVSKVLNKKILWILPSKISRRDNNGSFFLGIVTFFSTLICSVITDKIILYSTNLIKDWHFQKQKHKISIAHEQFLDVGQCKVEKQKINKGVVGFVGRFSQEKGILNFVKAIPLIIKVKSEVRFLICGDGPLKTTIDLYLTENNLTDKVEFSGWVKHERLPVYLGKMDLLVMPSYTEGLPNTMLEAMGCGTVVLATKVGAITDVISDNYTGLLMMDNSPKCISENVIRALNNSDLGKISQNALKLVSREFTFSKAVESYSNILSNL